MKTWICADWHLGEMRFELMGRPFKHQMEMVDWMSYQHNMLVGADDIVLMVGDVCYQKTEGRGDRGRGRAALPGREGCGRGGGGEGVETVLVRPGNARGPAHQCWRTGPRVTGEG